MFSYLGRDNRPGRNSSVLRNDHDPITHLVQSVVYFLILGEGLNHHVIPDAGVFIDDCALDVAVPTNP